MYRMGEWLVEISSALLLPDARKRSQSAEHQPSPKQPPILQRQRSKKGAKTGHVYPSPTSAGCTPDAIPVDLGGASQEERYSFFVDRVAKVSTRHKAPLRPSRARIVTAAPPGTFGRVMIHTRAHLISPEASSLCWGEESARRALRVHPPRAARCFFADCHCYLGGGAWWAEVSGSRIPISRCPPRFASALHAQHAERAACRPTKGARSFVGRRARIFVACFPYDCVPARAAADLARRETGDLRGTQVQSAG